MKNKSYSITNEQEERFNVLAREKKELITKGLYKVKIPKSLHQEFYNFGLEGLLVSFLILEDDGIEACDFDKFALTVIKRKLIDEIRRRNKEKSVPIDFSDNTLLHSCNTNSPFSKPIKYFPSNSSMYVIFLSEIGRAHV